MAIIRDSINLKDTHIKNKYAIVVYVDDYWKCKVEFSWLWKSWIMWSINKKWDLVVYVSPTCEKEIYDTYKSDGFVVIPQPPLQEENSFCENYKFVNSFGMFRDDKYYDLIRHYDFLFRTDCDTFLAPSFKYYQPYSGVLEIGRGAQTTSIQDNKIIDEIDLKLKEFRDLYKLNDSRIKNVGASILGPSNYIHRITQAHHWLTAGILKQGWKENDKGVWPGWYKGIASMYAIELAVSHFITRSQMKQGNVDVWCRPAPIQIHDLHYHAWQQNQNYFDKIQWFAEYTASQKNVLSQYLKEKQRSKPCLHVKFTKFPKTAGEYCLMIANHDITYLKKMAKLFKFN